MKRKPSPAKPIVESKREHDFNDFKEFERSAPFYLGQPFSDEDHHLLGLVAATLPGLSAMLGSHCEVVLNSLENPAHSVIASYNANVSGRKVGTPITAHGLRVINGILAKGENHLCQYPRGPKGQRIKSAVIPLLNPNGRCLGTLSIGLNLEMPLADFMQENYPPINNGQDNVMVFGGSPEGLIEEYVTRFEHEANFEKGLKKRERVRFIVQKLEQHGVFQLRDAVAEVSRKLELNPGTVYMHLRELRKKDV